MKLDIRFMKVSSWPLNKKLIFLLTKYASIAKHFVRPFVLSQSKVTFAKQDLFYDSKLGLAGYQSMLTRHQYMLQVANVKETEISNILDCGANVGFFSLMAHEIFPRAKIYALEPVPQTLSALNKNVKNIGNIKTFDNAISDTAGHAYMTFNEDDSVVSHLTKTGKLKVRTTTLDIFCAKNNIQRIDILKIDTETFEAHVLRGATNALSFTRYLFLEVTLKQNNNYTLSYIMSLLYSTKYEYELVAFRNYGNKYEGAVEIMDCLLVNTKFSK